MEPMYRPILKGYRGELEALGHLDPTLIPLVTPILEVPATDAGAARDAYGFWLEVRQRVPRGLRIGVDLGARPDIGTGSPRRSLDEDLAESGIPVLPVIGVADSDRRLAEHGETARTHLLGAIVRFRLRQDLSGHDAPTVAVERVWRACRLVPEQCDLVIDLADVGCAAEARQAELRVRRLVGWAGRYAWRSVTVAAGAMPVSLSGLATDAAFAVGRWDWLLWQRLADLGVRFGDYGISSPVPAPRLPRDHLPTIRYTAEDVWWIYRWSRRGGARSDDRFYDLCRTLVSAAHWTPTGAAFSWGDHEISRHARYTSGPGSAASWTAWGTSHHLAHVIAGLSRPAPQQRDGGMDRRTADRGGRGGGRGDGGNLAGRAWPPSIGEARRAG
jgi:hypothetical protein